MRTLQASGDAAGDRGIDLFTYSRGAGQVAVYGELAGRMDCLVLQSRGGIGEHTAPSATNLRPVAMARRHLDASANDRADNASVN